MDCILETNIKSTNLHIHFTLFLSFTLLAPPLISLASHLFLLFISSIYTQMTEACINFSPYQYILEIVPCQFIEMFLLLFYSYITPHCICVHLFNQSPRFEHLVCFRYFVITNSATVSNLNLVHVCIFISLEVYLQGKFLK